MKFFTFQSTPLERANKMEFNCNPYHQSIKIVKRLGLGLGTGNRESRIETVPVLTV